MSDRYLLNTILEDVNIEDFLNPSDSLLDKVSKSDFLRYSEDGKTNADRIFNNYSLKDQNDQTIKTKYSQFDLDTIKANTSVLLKLSEYQEQLLMIGGENVFLDQNQTLQVYLTEEQRRILEDPKYVKVDTITSGDDINLQIIEENCQVWIYVKSIDKLLDISPVVSVLTTSKSDIGTFSISLNPIEINIDRESNSISSVFITGDYYVDYLNYFEIKKKEQINISFFDKYCQQNDVVFIRFEKLQSESNMLRFSTFGSHGIEVSKTTLSDQIFDMIGLVDLVGSGVNFENTDYSINITGRDLMKVLVEDGSYLMDLVYAQGAENIFYYLGNENDKAFKRNFVDNGAFQYLFKEFLDPISTYMGFIINQLSNVGWSGDNDLFSYYPKDQVPKKTRIGIENEKRYQESIEQNGVWKIIHLKVDPNLKDRRIVDSSFIDQDGTLYEQFKKACQSPFVEFWGDTYGSQFNFVARQQPFDKEGMRQIVGNEYYTTIKSKDIFQQNLNWETEFYSWFQFIPNNALFGDDPYFLSASFPIIYFDKYVEHFGNHRKTIQDNYVSGKAVDGSRSEKDKESVAKGLFNDLKYVIESESVLPFTRTGTVVINGDRRIKRGSFILLESTNEIYYVESVMNTISFSRNNINRITTLQLKRGMFLDFIRGYSILNGTEYPQGLTYYNIINSKIIVDNLYRKYLGDLGNDLTTTTQQIKVDFGVNLDIFDFFLKRKQIDNI